MASYSGPRPAESPATSVWTRPPERPSPYRFTARMSDMAHGWRDGKRGIPLVSDAVAAVTTVAETATEAEAEAVDAEAPPEPWTPRMEVLLRLSRERIEGERIRLADDLSVLMQRAAESRHLAEALTERSRAHGQALERAQKPPEDTDLAKRRLAEQDTQRRPDGLVIDRRQAAWELRLRSAQEQHQATAAQLARATQALRYHEDLIAERTTVAACAARRHHELALRRVATYLQQLVRTHRRGPELNALLMQHRVGPDLPTWVSNATEEASDS